MDKDRQIRFLYPPLIFIASLLLGIFFDSTGTVGKFISDFIKNDINANIAIALLGASSIVLLLGFLLGTLTVLSLRLIFFWNRFNYEFKLSKVSYNQIGKLILKEPTDSIANKDKMYAGIVFDHSYIPENIHRWIIRRWNAFFISSSSTVALLSSLLIGHLFKITFTKYWICTVIISTLLFVIQAISSWKETMKMVEFMIRVKNRETTAFVDQFSFADQGAGKQ